MKRTSLLRTTWKAPVGKPIKRRSPKTTWTRKAAESMPCMIRVPGVCTGDPETVVLCHYRMAGYAGTGLKPDDDMGAWGCDACHAFVDGRMERPAGVSYAELRLMHAEGVLRTQHEIKLRSI